MVAYSIYHWHFLRIEHTLVEALPIIDLGILFSIPCRAVRQVSNNHHTVQAAETRGVVTLLDQGTAEFKCRNGLISVHVSVADDCKVGNYLFFVEIRVFGNPGDTCQDDGAEQ